MPLRKDFSEVPYYTEDFSENMWQRLLDDENQFMVFKDEGDLIGIASITPDSNGDAELSFYIKPEYRRQGLGTELVGRLCDHAVELYPEKQIIIRIRKENIPSIHTAEKAGAVLKV